MILTHPLNRTNDANKKAIEKYKDREVYVKSAFGWLMNIGTWSEKKFRCKFTFKEALKKTKNYPQSTKIEYHFIDAFGENKIDVNDFLLEEISNNPAIKFDEYRPHGAKTK